MPGLRRYQVSQGTVASAAGPSGIHLMAILTFDNMAAVQNTFGSAEGKATATDVPKFASGGADIIFFDTRDV
jgi:uncharacterized protein (TIGR02118 family)